MSIAKIRVMALVLVAACAWLAACTAEEPVTPKNKPLTEEAPKPQPATEEAPEPKPTPVAQRFVLTVEGMTCGHCEASIQREVKFCAGVKEITASHEERQVVVKGVGMDQAEVRTTIEKLGFTVEAVVAHGDAPAKPETP